MTSRSDFPSPDELRIDPQPLTREQRREALQLSIQEWSDCAWPAFRSDAWWTEYRRYLDSLAWKWRRRQTVRLAGGHCERCDRPLWGSWIAHHLTYDRVGYEAPNDLQALCHPCHELIHGRGER